MSTSSEALPAYSASLLASIGSTESVRATMLPSFMRSSCLLSSLQHKKYPAIQTIASITTATIIMIMTGPPSLLVTITVLRRILVSSDTKLYDLRSSFYFLSTSVAYMKPIEEM